MARVDAEKPFSGLLSILLNVSVPAPELIQVDGARYWEY